MPTEASTVSRIGTRAKNAEAHPGLQGEAPKRKRRTKAEIEADKQKAQAAKDANEMKKEAGLKKIAALEEKLEKNDANDATPRPRPVPQRRGVPLRRTSSHALIKLYDDDPSEPPTDAPTDIEDQDADDGYETTDTEKPAKAKEPKAKEPKGKVRNTIVAAVREAVSYNADEAGETTDTDVEKPARKKVKESSAREPKGKVRAAINAARKGGASKQADNGLEEGEERVDDSDQPHGLKRKSTTRFGLRRSHDN